MRLPLLLVGLIACSGADQAPDSQHARTGVLGYESPRDWKHVDAKTRDSATSTWTPAANDAKESVSVVWTAVRPLPTQPDAIRDLLVQGERGLNEVSSTSAVPIKSVGGLSGFQIESDFTAANRQRYHRVHAVLLDGDALVHVFYVAAQPDENRESYRLMLNSIANEKS